ncbi:MAG: hypothetical protein GC137_01780 [Alphaproteobacteria bacterium]|nr:hypothetical protein [Alphaproteobacteria bacterium]
MNLTKRLNNWLTERFEKSVRLLKKSSISLDGDLHFMGRKSHRIMTWPYVASNTLIYFGEFAYHLAKEYALDYSKLNPANDMQTAAGAIALTGALVNLMQDKHPVAFNLCGVTTVAKTGVLIADGWDKAGRMMTLLGNIPSLTIGLMMTTDRRFLRQTQKAANDNPDLQSGTKLGRRFYMGAYLLAGGLLAISAAAKDNDVKLQLYWLLQLIGSAGMLSNDEKASKVLQEYVLPEDKPERLEI